MYHAVEAACPSKRAVLECVYDMYLSKANVPRLYGVTFLICSVEAGVFSYEHCMMYDIQLYRPCGFNQRDNLGLEHQQHPN